MATTKNIMFDLPTVGNNYRIALGKKAKPLNFCILGSLRQIARTCATLGRSTVLNNYKVT